MKIKIIKPIFRLETIFDEEAVLKMLEKIGRISHKSEAKIKEGSTKEFVKKIINLGHESVLEHFSITVTIICDRGVSHEIVRHRLASYTQESTRYCNYADEIIFIKPVFFKKGSPEYDIWKKVCETAAWEYQKLISLGRKPEEARTILPNSLKTEIAMTCNLREWRHIFSLRCSSFAHPQTRETFIPILKCFKEKLPIIFSDFAIENNHQSPYPFVAQKIKAAP